MAVTHLRVFPPRVLVLFELPLLLLFFDSFFNSDQEAPLHSIDAAFRIRGAFLIHPGVPFAGVVKTLPPLDFDALPSDPLSRLIGEQSIRRSLSGSVSAFYFYSTLALDGPPY